jgi:hypothetical protein
MKKPPRNFLMALYLSSEKYFQFRAVLKIKFFHRYDVFVVRNNIISADNENLQPKNYF